MGFDFDDIFLDGAATNARAGKKYQPKANQSRKRSSASVLSSQPAQIIPIAKPPEKDDYKGTRSVNRSPDHVANRESAGLEDNLHSNAILRGDHHSSIGKSDEENADIFIGLELLDDFHSQSTTIKVNGASGSPPEVDEFSTSCPVNTDPGTSFPHSEATKEGVDVPVVSLVDDVAEELPVALDPLTCGEAAISTSDRDFHIEHLRIETEFQEAETYSSLETLDIMSETTTRSGLTGGKSQSMLTAQIQEEENGDTIPNLEVSESVCCPEDDQWDPQAEFMNDDSIPAFPPNDLDFSSVGFNDSIPTDPTSELLGNKEAINLMETSHADGDIHGGNQESVPEMTEVEAGSPMGRRGKRINAFQLVDEYENEASAEYPRGNGINEDNNNNNDDEECQVENESQNKRVRRKSRKPVAEKEKPIRKRKKPNEVLDELTKAPPKKFSHSTRRNRRQVDKTLLETPEHEIDFQKLPIRDLIMLAEYKERTMNREVTTSGTPSSNQRTANSSASRYDEEEAFGREQDRDSQDEQEYPRVQEKATYFNYQSHMEKSRTVRWSKQDTELFYEAVQQFGTDLSMIQQLFPGRTRRQVKLKYKKEERQNPLKLREALVNRSKDHSHFEVVIERLQQIAALEKQNTNRDGSDCLSGEEAEEEVTPEINEEEEVAKSVQVEGEEVKNLEADVPAIQSPDKSSDSEDDLYRWSQYKSEL